MMTTNNYRYEIGEVDLDENIQTTEWQVICAQAEQPQKVHEDFDPQKILAHKGGYLAFKRVCDVIISLLVMIIFCWLYAILAIAVKADDTGDPIIFKQTRLNCDMLSFDECVSLDRLYIQKCSFWTDFKLIIQTIGCIFMAQGA